MRETITNPEALIAEVERIWEEEVWTDYPDGSTMFDSPAPVHWQDGKLVRWNPADCLRDLLAGIRLQPTTLYVVRNCSQLINSTWLRKEQAEAVRDHLNAALPEGHISGPYYVTEQVADPATFSSVWSGKVDATTFERIDTDPEPYIYTGP